MLTMSHLSDLFHPNQIFLQIYHIWNTKHWDSMPLTSFQSRFCGSHGHNALPQFFPFRRISMTNSSFGAMDQEAGCDDAVQLRKECGPCSDSLTRWHSSSSSVAAPPLAQTPRSLGAFHMSFIPAMVHRCAPMLGSAHQTYSCGPLHKGLLKKRTLSNLYISFPRPGTGSFVPWFPTSEKPPRSPSTRQCPASPLAGHILLLWQVHSNFLFISYLRLRREREGSPNSTYCLYLLICIPCWITDNLSRLVNKKEVAVLSTNVIC